MGLRGRESKNKGKFHRIYPERPKAPRGLPKEAQAEWRKIVESLPPGSFKTWELPLLEKYVMAAYIYGLAMKEVKTRGAVVEMGSKGYKAPNPALTVANRQVALMASLATKLRLCPNSRVTKWKAGTTPEHRPSSRRKGLLYEPDED